MFGGSLYFLNGVGPFCGFFSSYCQTGCSPSVSPFLCLTIVFSLQACWELGNATTPSQRQAEGGWREALGQREAPAEEGAQIPRSSPVLDWTLCSSQTPGVRCWTLCVHFFFFLRIGKGCCHASSRHPDSSKCPAGAFLIQPRPLFFQKTRLMIRQWQFIKEQSCPLLMGKMSGTHQGPC